MKKIAHYIPILSLLFIVFIVYANRVDDLDFWWHLKSGQYIFETHTLLQKDYFSYASELPADLRNTGNEKSSPGEIPTEKSTWYWMNSLKSSWLSQLIFYLVYAAGGFIGIGILKSVVFVATYLILYITMMRREADHLISLLVLCLIAFIGIDFNFTRPQIFSFLLFPCVLYTFYDFKKGGKTIYVLPALMLFWANLHGGFILGIFTIITVTFVEFLKYMFNNISNSKTFKQLDKKRLTILGLVTIASILASLINPNMYRTFLFPFIFEQSIFKTIEEYHRPMLYEYHAYWFMLTLVVVFIVISIWKRRLDLSDLGILLIVILPSLKGIRYIIFFALGSGVFLAQALTCTIIQLKDWKPMDRLLNRPVFQKGHLSFFMSTLCLIICVAIGISGKVLQFDMGDKRYPSGAVAFIQNNKPIGNMFNPYNWGGYLVWHLFPDYKVFIYGRTLNETAFLHCKQIFTAEQGLQPAAPLWERLLDVYGVNFIVTSAVSSAGTIYKLIDNLYASDQWKLVLADGKSMIFLRNIPDNRTLIKSYELPKEKIDDEIIGECKQGIEETPSTWGYYETLGYMYMKKNRLQEALMMFEKYLTMNPYNEKVIYYRDLIKEYIKKYN